MGNGGTADGRGNYKPYLKLPAPELEAVVAREGRAVETRAGKSWLHSIRNWRAGQAAWEETALTYQPKWEVLTPQNLKADNGVTLKALPDGSVLAGGAMPPSSIFEVTADSRLKNITAFRLELIPDESLPGGGSGRGAGGKGVVTLFEVRTGDTAKWTSARITADFKSEESVLNLVIRPVGAVEARLGRQSGDEQAALRRDRNVADVQPGRRDYVPDRQRIRGRAGRAVPDFGDGFGVSGSGAGGDGYNSADGRGGAFGERRGGADEVLRHASVERRSGE